jgi:hypothetical protein
MSWGGEPTSQKKFQTIERARWIWQNSLKCETTKFMIYVLWKSKPIVEIDSYHQRTSFSCIAYFCLKHGCVELKRNRWELSSCIILASCLVVGRCSTKRKPYNTKVVRNEEVHLLLKVNFKRLSVCNEFSKIHWKVKTQNLQFTAYKTRNRLSEWIHIIDAHLFHVQLVLVRSMVVLIWNEWWRSFRESEPKHAHVPSSKQVA